MFVRARLGAILLCSTAVLLAGCPQLLSDGFYDGFPSDAGAGPLRDAGALYSGPLAATGKQPAPDPQRGGGPRAPGSEQDGGLTAPPPGLEGTAFDAGAPGQQQSPDASLVPSTPVAELREALAARFAFDGAGQDAIDSLGGEKGWLYNTSLDGEGLAHLTGSDEYVSLPNGLLSSGNDKTIEAWLVWRGGDDWQRIFDFGTNTGGELQQGTGTSYLFLTPQAQNGAMGVAYTRAGMNAEVRLTATQALPTNTLCQVAVVVDSAADTLSLYLNGNLERTVTLTERLSGIVDNNVWIGRSQFAVDPSLDGDVLDFRVYDQPLRADQIALSFHLGSDSPLTDAQ